MNRRKALTLVAAAPLAFRTRSALAGGMALVYLLGDVPAVQAGMPWRLRFVVLAHDVASHVASGMQSTISFFPKNGGDAVLFEIPEVPISGNAPMLYETEIVIPKAGAYKWSVASGPYAPTFFPTLEVSEGVDSDATSPEATDANVIHITSDGFQPADVTVASGTTIRWLNGDPQSAHQVVWSDILLDDSALFPLGESFELTLTEPGSYGYYCGPHPHMTGSVTVSES